MKMINPLILSCYQFVHQTSNCGLEDSNESKNSTPNEREFG